jgi:pseudouridine synthase
MAFAGPRRVLRAPVADACASRDRLIVHASMLIAFNKPYGVLCQFTDRSQPPRPTLAGFGLPAGAYPAGRLDFDSEGLLLLTDDGRLAHRLTDPAHKQPKTYWVQVEGTPDDAQLQQLREGVTLSDGPTRPAQARRLDAPALWPRDPPVPRSGYPRCGWCGWRSGRTGWTTCRLASGARWVAAEACGRCSSPFRVCYLGRWPEPGAPRCRTRSPAPVESW